MTSVFEIFRIDAGPSNSHTMGLTVAAQIIETMYGTGLVMQPRYKETSPADLALNVIEY